jgi:hypothetical protein
MKEIKGISDFVGEEVFISYEGGINKLGVVIEVGVNGVLFKLTNVSANDKGYRVGDYCFVAYSCGLKMSYFLERA